MTENLIDIPGYSVHGRLGKGGMAEVYLATQQSLHRKVAVKVLLNVGDEEFNTRFIQEGHIVASLHNPSIITIYDINKLAGPEFLTEVRRTHEIYGKALGVTQAEELPLDVRLGEPLRELGQAIVDYSLQLLAHAKAEPSASTHTPLRPGSSPIVWLVQVLPS